MNVTEVQVHRKVLRRLTQAAVLLLTLLIPVLDLLRFDVQAGRLYLLGQVWSFSPVGQYLSGAGGDPVGFLLKGVFPLLIFFLSLPVWGAVLGRFLCGWFCPVGTMFEIVGFFIRHASDGFRVLRSSGPAAVRRKELLCGALSALSLTVWLVAAGVFLSGFLMSPSEIWREVSSMDPSPFFLVTASGMTAVAAAVYIARRTFCSYICLFGITMTIPFIVSPFSLRIRFDRKRGSLCTNCGRCERACIMEIRPRAQKRKVNPRCINCGECITACEEELGRKQGLLHYGFGKG